MLESIVALLYISGMVVTATAIYGTVDNVSLPRALVVLVLWPLIPAGLMAVLAWEFVVDRFR